MDYNQTNNAVVDGGLKSDSLGTWELCGVSLAQMAPAYSLFTTLGLIVAGVGFGAPVVFLLAAIATFFHVNTVAEFSRKCPSAGSYTCFISRTFGNYTGITVGLVFVIAQILEIASIVLVLGTWIHFSLFQITGININWLFLMCLFLAVALFVCIRGVTISTGFAVALFGFEVLVLVIASTAMIATHVHSISLKPFDLGKLFTNFSGLGLAFPLAVYPYLGSSNAAAMAEEARNPRSSIRIAVFLSTIIGGLLYVGCSYATIVGSGFNSKLLTAGSYPLITVADRSLGRFSFILLIAGVTSTISLTVVILNAISRVVYNLSREGVLPKPLSASHAEYKTPHVALYGIATLSAILAAVIGVIYGPINAFNWTGTLGTIPLIIIFVIVNIALPIYFYRNHRDDFSVIPHVLFPLIGSIVYLLPIYASVEPGQPLPYNYFGITTLVFFMLGVVYSRYLVTRHKSRLNLGLYVDSPTSIDRID